MKEMTKDIKRIPMDGGMTDDVGMMTCPIMFEHGEEGVNSPALRFYFELFFEDDFEIDPDGDEPSEIVDFMVRRYGQTLSKHAKVGRARTYYTEIECQDWDVRDGKFVMYFSAEFSAGDYLREESTEEWIEDTVRHTNFYKVYNENVIFWTARDVVTSWLEQARGVAHD